MATPLRRQGVLNSPDLDAVSILVYYLSRSNDDLCPQRALHIRPIGSRNTEINWAKHDGTHHFDGRTATRLSILEYQ